MFVDTARLVASCALRGLKDTFVPMLIFVGLGAVITLPICYLFGFTLHMGAIGVRWGFVIGFAVGAIILILRFHKFSEVESKFMK